MVTHELLADIEGIERNVALYEEINFSSRAEALNFLEFHVLDRLDGLLMAQNPAADLLALRQRAQQVKHRLEATDESLFQQLRADIRAGRCRGQALRTRLTAYAPTEGSTGHSDAPEIGYDALDDFTNGLFTSQVLPDETIAKEPEMVFYQKTPARIILDLVGRAQLTTEDVFYDIGAGLGQVPILVHLLSGAVAKGIEIEPAYCALATAWAADLQLPGVTFIAADARRADYSDGTVFFLYTPFRGSILQAVLAELRRQAQHRCITLFTYGPCTFPIAEECWLRCADESKVHLYQLCEFRSCPAGHGL
ncbi:class I SAM-dependent methyltransferase [Hymenobacter rubidus]|uniref:class I SAM-dependent methyltransferase n=1 Tax=Hymenobacter rubidus TaxID=1441626 RepID=UPI00191D6653|nr:class I SAM-dependent methyltransferase [Hymenobacter rubidus]